MNGYWVHAALWEIKKIGSPPKKWGRVTLWLESATCSLVMTAIISAAKSNHKRATVSSFYISSLSLALL